jgi:hypothetical protein
MEGAGHGVLTPIKQPRDGNVLDADNQICNTLRRATRAIGERGFALLTTRWRALQRITASPSKVGHIVAGALVLTQFENLQLRQSC